MTAKGSWIIVHLSGGPFQIGFQNGYLTAQSSDYAIRVDVGAPGSHGPQGLRHGRPALHLAAGAGRVQA